MTAIESATSHGQAAGAPKPSSRALRTSASLISPGHSHALSPSTEPELSPLTPREQEVLRLLAEGATNPDIGRKLAMSVFPVSSGLDRRWADVASGKYDADIKSMALRIRPRSQIFGIAVEYTDGQWAEFGVDRTPAGLKIVDVSLALNTAKPEEQN